MAKKNEKTIAELSRLSLDFLLSFGNKLKNKPDEKLIDFFEEWKKEIKWKDEKKYPIVNQAVMLIHLYGLIVYPKASFDAEIPKDLKLSEINKTEWGDFKFLSLPNSKLEGQLTLEFLIRKIRNSISHGRIEIYNDKDFEFSDNDDTKIWFNITGLQKFTEKFNDGFMNNKW